MQDMSPVDSEEPESWHAVALFKRLLDVNSEKNVSICLSLMSSKSWNTCVRDKHEYVSINPVHQSDNDKLILLIGIAVAHLVFHFETVHILCDHIGWSISTLLLTFFLS